MTKPDNAVEEKINTEDFGMPIRYYFTDSSDPKELTMFAHWHNEIEIEVFTKGNSVTTIDNTEVIANEKDILIIPSQSIHSGYSESSSITVHTIVFHAEVLCPLNRDNNIQKYFDPFINRTADIPYVIRTTDKGYENLYFCLKEIVQLAKEKPACHELLILNHLTAFFIHLYTNGYVSIKPNNETADKNYLAVKNSIAYIEENYSKPLTVDNLASQAGFSKSRFMTIFKEYTNTTCKKFINTYRLESSLKLLRDTDNTVLNIAIASGYNNISLYNREFKKAYGVTPLEYRKNNRNYTSTI